MKHNQKLALAAAVALALSSQQAAALDIKQYLPSWLGGSPAVNISVTPQPQSAEQVGQVAPPASITPAPVAPATPVENLALAGTEQKIDLPVNLASYTVNPYTGVRANIDRRRGEIEQATLDSELALKTIELEKQKFLLSNKDKIFSKELKERLGEGLGNRGNNFAGDYPANDILPKSDIKKKAKAKVVVEPIVYAPPPVYVPPPPQMVGVIDIGGIKKALLSVGGMSPVAVSAGETFMGKRVSQVDVDSVIIDGNKVAMHQSTNTLVNPDKQKLGAAAGVAAGGVQTGANTPIGGALGLPQTSTYNGIPMQAGIPATVNPEFNQIMTPAQQADAEAMANLQFGR